MTKRRIPLLTAALLLTCLAVLSAGATNADGSPVYAYIAASDAWLTLGEETRFTVVVPPDAQGLEYRAMLLFTPDRTQSDRLSEVMRWERSAQRSFGFTPQEKGDYQLRVVIYNPVSSSMNVESGMYTAYEQADASSPDAVPGKVKAIVAQALRENLPTDYDKALWLHDWLTHNADYDESKSIHVPEGVLLKGSGVCESYALAYGMLLHEIGIDSIFLTGSTGFEDHGWNMVKLDGEWTHVDVTADDPLGGGQENHDYFGMNDMLIGRDHSWKYGNCVPPPASTLAHNHLIRAGEVLIYRDEAELGRLLGEALKQGQTSIQTAFYGTDPSQGYSSVVTGWISDHARYYYVDSYSYSKQLQSSLGGSLGRGFLEIVYGDYAGFETFSDEEAFAAIMVRLMKEKTPVAKLYYMGDGEYFGVRNFVKGWLETNPRLHFARAGSMEISGSTDKYWCVISLTYGDYDDYAVFEDEPGLAALLADAVITKPESLKLYYLGKDPAFNLVQRVKDWLALNSNIALSGGGSGNAYEIDLKIQWISR